MRPGYVWFVHQPTVAGWLKRDMAVRRPALRFAFSRPGLTTFKVDDPRHAKGISSPYARAWGTSLGRVDTGDVAGVLALAATLSDAPLRLHVFERDPDLPADERDAAVIGTRPAALEKALRAAAASNRLLDGDEAQPGDVVLDVIVAPSEADDDGIFVGWHKHDRPRGSLAGTSHGRMPGGTAHIAIPAAAPSRAWAKIEEAIAWSGLEPRAGENAVEIGSSPGGASFALLERGLTVHGVDPGVMDPLVMTYHGASGNVFVHHAMPAAEVDKRALPRPMHWLASDVNLAPMVALKYVERYVALGKGQRRGAFITMKINDDGIFEAMPRLMDRVERMAEARWVRYVQLPSHRSEIVAIIAW
ncbi:MAG: hypothetical protein IPL79_13005 [Myxococcales bacterium]|nr:hypothetical protein [Myxococcales bacterium]